MVFNLSRASIAITTYTTMQKACEQVYNYSVIMPDDKVKVFKTDFDGSGRILWQKEVFCVPTYNKKKDKCE